MTKLLIEDNTFIFLINQKKLEVIDWLINQGITPSYIIYLHANNLETIQWLYTHGVPLLKTTTDNSSSLLEELIKIYCNTDNFLLTQEFKDILKWYLSILAKHIKQIEYDNIFNTCLKTHNIELLNFLLSVSNKNLSYKQFIVGIDKSDLVILDYLHTKNCKYDKVLDQYVLKSLDKKIVKWFINNDYI
jgi:hypothetical protein